MDYLVTWAPGMSLETLEHNVIQKAYGFYKENKTSTAHALGISIRTLDARLEKIESLNKENEKRNEQAKRERDIFLARSRGVQAESWTHMESPASTSSQPDVSVFVGKEVQEVLPKPSAAASAGRRRG